MMRRQFVILLGGVAVSWPLAATAQQQSGRMRRIGVLTYWASSNRQGQAGLAAFKEVLRQSGWTEGVNIQFETRWSADSTEQARKFAAELVALAPDVILSSATPSTQALQSLTNTSPIVFVTVADPVGVGLVQSLARPGSNITGFMNFEYSVSGKWLEILKQIVPGLARVAVIRDASNPAAIGQFSAIQAAAQQRAIEPQAVNVRDAGEIERALVEFARKPNGGLIVTPAAGQSPQRDLILMQPGSSCRRSMPIVRLSLRVASSGSDLTASISSVTRQAMSIGSSRARSQPIFRYRYPPNTKWRST